MNATALMGAPSSPALDVVFTGSNDPSTDTFLNGLIGQFRDEAGKLGSGIEQTTSAAVSVIAILFLVHSTAATAPGLALTYTREIGEEKAKTYGGKVLNYALKRVDPSVRDRVDHMFGQVKAQMGQALDYMIEHYTPAAAPTIDDAKLWIEQMGGIQGLGMKFMSARQSKLRDERQREEQQRQAFAMFQKQKQDEANEQLAKDKGFATFAEYQAHLDEQRRQELIGSARARIGSRSSEASITDLREGAMYLVLDGKLRLIEAADQDALLKCAGTMR